jgi:hypothetical protein
MTEYSSANLIALAAAKIQWGWKGRRRVVADGGLATTVAF